MIEEAGERDGRVYTMRKAEGVRLDRCLPGIYWANLFGPPVTEWIGAERIRTCPCREHREIAPGYHLLIAYADIDAHDTAETIRAKDVIREHLGAERFFDRRLPTRHTVAPPVDRSALHRPQRPRGSEELEELRERARQMGGWLETREGEMRLHLEGSAEPDDDL